MTWFKLDDQWHTHPKVMRAGNAAAGLWARCGSWSSQHLTEGFVPDEVVRAYGTPTEIRKILAVGLWQKVDGGYQIPDFLEFNPTREQVLAEREATRARVAKFRDRKRERSDGNDTGNGVTNGVSNAPCNGHVTGSPSPSPSPYPYVLTNQHSSSISKTPLAPAAAAAPDVETPGLAQVLDLAVRVRERQSAGTIKHPARWAAAIRRNMLAEHRDYIAAQFAADPDPDVIGIVSTMIGCPRTDVVTARMGGGYL